MHGGTRTDAPRGAGGLEWAFDKLLAGTNGTYDKKLPLRERNEKGALKPGADIQTTLVPEIQKTAAEALPSTCATNGAKIGVAGIPGEETGLFVGSPSRWDKTSAMRVGMGYGFAATGLQIAQAYATLANHGTLVHPVLVTAAATNCVVQVLSPSSADAIARMLKSPMPSTVQMCEQDREAGRTVYSSTNYIASCAGLVSADKIEYVVVVSFAKPRSGHTGDEVAQPAFVEIGRKCELQN